MIPVIDERVGFMVDISAELFNRLIIFSEETGKTIDEIVEEALKRWLTSKSTTTTAI